MYDSWGQSFGSSWGVSWQHPTVILSIDTHDGFRDPSSKGKKERKQRLHNQLEKAFEKLLEKTDLPEPIAIAVKSAKTIEYDYHLPEIEPEYEETEELMLLQ